MKTYIKRIVPYRMKTIIKKILFLRKWGFLPPPDYTDLSGYELLMDVIVQYKIYELEGDFVEIGAFLGGGTYKLCKLLERFKTNKKLYVIDIFDPEFDTEVCLQGISMRELYLKTLKGKNQYEIFKEVTKKCKNLVVIAEDSKKVILPCEKIAFAYIDGNHSPEYVENDFYLVWDKIVPNGIVAFDDYGYDLPQVTNTINKLIDKEKNKIKKVWTAGLKTIFIQKNSGG